MFLPDLDVHFGWAISDTVLWGNAVAVRFAYSQKWPVLILLFLFA